jgi:hypothetical protein
MVTRNFLNILAMTLESGNQNKIGCLRSRDVNGNTRFLNGYFSANFPYNPVQTFTLNATAAGISIGTGSIPASEDDYNLEQTITSGVNVVLTGTSYGAENPWYPFVKYDLTITNTGADPLVVTEVGYKQNCNTTQVIGSTRTMNSVLLLDRCVLDTPVTIAPGDAGIVTYRLQTNPTPVPPSVAGVQMASFAYGTDAQIAAILDAAAAGTIDLQRDAGWRVGDERVINVAAFTAGGNVSEPAQQVAIVITSFDEYMGCGNVMQFDFACSLSGKVRMNDTGTTTGGYGASEMKTVTLPALAEALPDWLKTRLKTFSALTGSGGAAASQQTIETVTGNKLALRSEVEIFGTHTYSTPGEGTALPYYASADKRSKETGLGNSQDSWLTRSPCNSTYYVKAGSNGSDTEAAATPWYVSPFGCL